MAGLVIPVIGHVVLSVSTITIFCNALVNINIRQNIIRWMSSRTFMFLLALLLLFIISGLYSENMSYWFDRCRTKLPFLALPLGFVTLPPLNKRRLYVLLLSYVAIIFIAAVCVMLNYFLHYSTYNELIKQGQAIPTPLNDHIRFSIEMAFACVLAFHLFIERFIIKYPVERWIIFAAGALLFIMLHILAVRSGLLALYVVMVYAFVKRMFDKRRYFRGVMILLLVMAMGFASVQLIPSLHNKLSYFFYEWSLIKEGDMKPGHSDAQRIVSTRYGINVGKEHPLIGVGAGDIKDTMTEKYKTDYGDENIAYKLPHNEFVFVFAALGVIGLVVFIISLLFPFFENKRYRDFLFTSFGIMMLFSLMTEHMLEIQVGIAFYLTFLLLFMNYIDNRNALIHTEDA